MNTYKTSKTFLIISFIAILGACSNQATYRAANGNGLGYKELKISEQRYRIMFKARGNHGDKARDFALLRAAELSLEKGYDWFEIVDSQTDVNAKPSKATAKFELAKTRTSAEPRCGLLSCTSASQIEREQALGIGMGDERSTSIARIEIWMEKGVRPDSRNSYLAQEVANNLREQLLNTEQAPK